MSSSNVFLAAARVTSLVPISSRESQRNFSAVWRAWALLTVMGVVFLVLERGSGSRK